MDESNCDFLLVAALPKEFNVAVTRVFDAKRLPKNQDDSRSYYSCVQETNFGKQYELKLFCVGRQGGQRTAAAVTQAILRWRPKHVIMFGIAAVIPGGSRKLGDFLVSDWIADFEETKKSKEDKPRPFLWRCDRELYSHIENEFPDFTHIGCIISQPNLSRNKKYRKSLVDHVYNYFNRDIVIGLEMEGGGLAKAIDELPHGLPRPGFILIKGAVDFGNYHKNDALQKDMAEKVARFVKDIIQSEPVYFKKELILSSRSEEPFEILPKSSTSPIIYIGDESATQDGRFFLNARFNLIVGSHPIELISLRIGYYAQGCLCLAYDGSIFIGNNNKYNIYGYMDIEEPLKFTAETTYFLNYSSTWKPPLPQQTPKELNAEFGDIVIEAECRVHGEYGVKQLRWIFNVKPGQMLKKVSKISDPPRLSDSEIERWRSIGRINEEQYKEILAVNQRRRYLSAIINIDHTFITYGFSSKTLELLRSLIQENLRQ